MAAVDVVDVQVEPTRTAPELGCYFATGFCHDLEHLSWLL